MEHYCLNCKRITKLQDLPLELIGDEILCRDCCGKIIYKIKEIYKGMPQEQFEHLKDEIIADVKTHMNEDVINVLTDTLNYKYYGTLDKSESVQHIQNAKENVAGYVTNDKPNDEPLNMFNNIGSKIKSLAKILTWIGIVSSVICGFGMMASGVDMLLFIGLMVAGLGSLLSWVSSFILYGFGQLIENSEKIVKSLEKK